MALADYSDLQAAILAWMERTGDAILSSVVTDIITLGEARLNRDLMGLRTTITETTLTGTTSSRELTLPSDFLAPVSLFLTTFTTQDYLRPIVIGLEPLQTTDGVPEAWGIDGTTINLDAPCDQAHTFLFRYHGKLALSDSATTNWLLTNYPDVYLYACLREAAVYLGDAESATGYEVVYGQARDAVRAAEAHNRRVAPLAVDPALATQRGFNITTGQ